MKIVVGQGSCGIAAAASTTGWRNPLRGIRRHS